MPLSLRLKNTASVARDHLANERTFLAWLRTSLTFTSVGVALTQLFRLPSLVENKLAMRISSIMGSVIVGMGIITTILGLIRYFHVQHVLQEGEFPVTRSMIIILFTLTFAIVAVALAILIETVAHKA